MLHNPNQSYMMYPMMGDQGGFQWNTQYGYNAEAQPNQSASVDSARASKSHGHSKSSSTEKEMKKVTKSAHFKVQQPGFAMAATHAPHGQKEGGPVNFAAYPGQQAAMNQFVPVYMLPPGFTGHPGAFNAALAQHAANQGIQGGQPQASPQMPNMYQMPTYGHNVYNPAQTPYGLPYGYPTQQKGYYNPPSGYTGSDYNSASGVDSNSTRASKSSDSGSKRTSRSLTSKDSATHSTGSNSKLGKGKTSTIKKPTIVEKKNNNVKKFQSTHQIIIQKGPKKGIVKQQTSCGRSHSTGSDLSAGCSASNCPPALVHRVCSHDSENSNSIAVEKRKISGCCSNECDHVGPIFENMRKFSNNQDFKKPDNDLTKKLIELIEFYLSDEYLAKDKYLLRQIRCKSEGYISIKLMTSFKKVKKLTRDWRSVRFALLQSPNLIVSPEGFRVKRATQLPENLRKPRLLSSVVTIRLTEQISSVDAITNMFSKFGEIGLVRILKPGKEIPSDLRNYATQVPDIGKTMCAVVDFEQSESALQAVRCLKDELVEQKMRLALLGPRVRRTLYKQDRGDDNEDEDDELELTDKNNNISNANNVEPETCKTPTAMGSKINEKPKTKLTTHSSNDSNTTSKSSQSSLDISIDSGNCGVSSGQHSADEDLKSHYLKDDNSKQALIKRDTVILVRDHNNKITSIYREPEGPGANPELNGFAFRRSQHMRV